jgi:predicted AlkP superfamily pyrophosphatase or phosphodiesterase
MVPQRLFALGCLSWLLVSASASSPRAQESSATVQPTPRLVVFISIDQMRGDYITRYGSHWTRGLRRLVDEGALFVQGAYPYFNTVTCAGHATMGTGAYPPTHGMVLNAWYDRTSGKSVTCTDDASVSLVTYGSGPAAAVGAGPQATAVKPPAPAPSHGAATPGPVSGAAAVATPVGHSARLLRTNTFADELRLQAGRTPRIVSLSMKPRSAINLAGHKGDVVLWFGGGTSGWTSSTAFGEGKNPFVEAFVAKNPIARDFTTPWTKAMPEGNYLFEDDGTGEKPGEGWTRTFPHPIRLDPSDKGSATRWAASPFADDYLGRFATAAIDEFKLGQTPGIDYLAVSFSMLDAVGHAFGPRSHEVQDTLVRLDKTIGDLLAALDAKVGAGRYVVALTGDHGVAPIPEQMKAMGVEAGRVDLKAVTASVEDMLVKRWGAAKDGSKYVAHVAYTDLYFAPGVVDRLKAEPATMKEVIDTMERVEGVLRVIPSHTLPEVHGTDDRLVRAARLSYMPDRSGDLFIMPKPYWLMSSAGTTHGTGYFYDERVPVLLFGAGIKPGKYWGTASPADLSPTLAALCGITMARPDGRVLSEALATPAAMPPTPTSAQRE